MMNSAVRKAFEDRPPSRPVADVQFSVGDNVKRLNDGAPGVVREAGLMGTLWVTWTDSGTTHPVKNHLIERA